VRALRRDRRRQCRRRQAEALDQIVVEHDGSAVGDCAEREFGLPVGADLEDDHDVQRRAQAGCDLRRDRHAAARKRHDHEIGPR